jgi:hypothetical protein
VNRIDFNADPDSAFCLSAYPESGSQTLADPDPGQPLAILFFVVVIFFVFCNAHTPKVFKAVLRMRDAYPGFDFFPSRIPDPNVFHPGSGSKNLSILIQKSGF